MANAILAKFASAVAFTKTIASLASSAGAVGQACQQTDLVDNTTNRYQRIHVYFTIKLGTSPTAGSVYFYLIKKDATNTIATDGAGASAGALTRLSARELRCAPSKASPATGDNIVGDFEIYDPGPTWGLLIGHDTGVALNSTEGNHVITYIGDNPEVQ